MLVWILLACAPEPETAGPLAWSYPLDDVLRITDAQSLGTHNSYHLRDDPIVTDEWDYAHRPLAEQAGQQGVRQFELDIHADGDTFRVYHAIGFDDVSTCDTLADCLGGVRRWSSANPAHFPLTFLLEPKDDAGGDPIDLARLDADILAAWPDAFTPDELRGDAATVHDAVLSEGWPVLGALRGRALFVLLDRDAHRDAYVGDGRPMFLDARSVDDPLAAYFLHDDPFDADIPAVVAAGFLVRTRIDDEGADVAGLASGAHSLSTDHPDDHVLSDGAPVRCNPVSAPPECTAAALEDPTFVSADG